MLTISLLCLIAGTAFAVYAVIESRGRGILPWAVCLIGLSLLLPHLGGL